MKWWTDDLVLGLGLYTVLVIAVKTTLEYCYTCVVAADTRSPEAMVTVTGYLYAAAGVAASILNAGGTRRLLLTVRPGRVGGVSPRRRFTIGNHLLPAGFGRNAGGGQSF